MASRMDRRDGIVLLFYQIHLSKKEKQPFGYFSCAVPIKAFAVALTISRELIPSILEMVDEGRIAFRPAVEISYLLKDEQEWSITAPRTELARLPQSSSHVCVVASV